MEKIEIINGILKKYLGVDIFNHDASNKNELDKKVSKKIDKYFTYRLSLEDVVKLVYGEDAKIIIKEDIISVYPSNIENIDLSSPDVDRILDLKDFGYKTISINYYIKQGINDDLIYIGTNKNTVYKYDEVFTENGFMSKLENVLNVELNPNTEHTEISYKKVWPDSCGALYTPADFRNCETVVESVNLNKAIKTKDGNIIAKSIDCKHFNGYSTDEFRPEKVFINFDFKQDELTSNLESIPDNVLKEMKVVLKKIFYNNKKEIIKDILVLLKEYINENINKSKKILFETLTIIYQLYPSIVEYSGNIDLYPPAINEKAFHNFKELSEVKKESFNFKFNESKNECENDLNNIEVEIDNIENEIEKILEQVELYKDNISDMPSIIFGIDEEVMDYISINFDLERLYRSFVEVFKRKENDILNQVENLRNQIADAKLEINHAKSFDVIYYGDFNILEDRVLDNAWEFVNVLEQYLSKEGLVQDIIDKNRLYKSTQSKLESINSNYKKEDSVCNNLLYDVNKVYDAFSNLQQVREQLSNFVKCLENINSIYYIGMKNSEEYKNLYFYIELLSSIINGSIFYSELTKNEKVLELLDEEKPIYKDDNYVTLIQNQLVKK